MSDQKENYVSPVDEGKYDELFKVLMKDPNFHLLPLPESIRKRFNIPLEVSSLGIAEATKKALTSRNDYTGPIEIRDQTVCEIEFPPIPESALPIEATLIMHQESEDSSSPHPSVNDEKCIADEQPQQSSSQKEDHET
jgi:hypothetical protein